MNFGKWIVVAFVLFAIFIGTLVTICVRQDVPLVTKDYYKEELAYEDQIQRVENTNALEETPVISFADNNLTIKYSSLSKIENGKLKLFRPSDEKLDQQFDVEPVNDSFENFEVSNPVPGMYRAKLTWEQDGKQYFIEKVIVI
jgi:hypothetical protein